MMEFLYFPQDKSDYIPAFISLFIFLAVAIYCYRLIKNISEKQKKKFEEQFPEAKRKDDHLKHATSSIKGQGE